MLLYRELVTLHIRNHRLSVSSSLFVCLFVILPLQPTVVVSCCVRIGIWMPYESLRIRKWNLRVSEKAAKFLTKIMSNVQIALLRHLSKRQWYDDWLNVLHVRKAWIALCDQRRQYCCCYTVSRAIDGTVYTGRTSVFLHQYSTCILLFCVNMVDLASVSCLYV